MVGNAKKVVPLDQDETALLRAENKRLKADLAFLREREKVLLGYLRQKIGPFLEGPEEPDHGGLPDLLPPGEVGETLMEVAAPEEGPLLAGDEMEAIFDSAGAGIMVVDIHGRILSQNAKSRELFLAGGEQGIGAFCGDLICRGEAGDRCILDLVRKSGEGQQVSDLSFRGRHFDVLATPIRTDGGEISRVVVVYNDITERRKGEQALAEAEMRLKTILDSVQAGIILVDEKTHRVVRANPRALEMFGGEAGDVIGSPCHNHLCPSEEGQCPISDLGERVNNSERVLLQKDGRTLPILKTVAPVMVDGRPHYIESFVDISEQKKAEQALHSALADVRASRDRTDAILSSVADALIVTDLQSRIVHMNRAAEELLGTCLRDSCGVPIGRAIGDRALRAQLEDSLSAESASTRGDFTVPGPDPRHPRIFQGRTSAIHHSEGICSGRVIIMHEVTREREVERLKKEFISMAAHELQTPLTAILGFSELLASDEELPVEVQKEGLACIYEKAEALSLLVDDILDISRIDRGRQLMLEPELCSLAELVEEFVAPYAGRSDRQRLVLSLPREPVELLVDRKKLGKVFDNLLGNAFKYSPEGGPVLVKANRERRGCRVSVVDRGIGMSEEQVKKVFEEFYRVDASDTALGGVGLGMSIARHIVEAHGGRIWVESALGEGTEVSFWLPLESESKN